jgi:hypothetical protein
MPRCCWKRRNRSIAFPPSPSGGSSPGLRFGDFIGGCSCLSRLRCGSPRDAGELSSFDANCGKAWDAITER